MTLSGGSAARTARVTAATAAGSASARPVDSVSSGATGPGTGPADSVVPWVPLIVVRLPVAVTARSVRSGPSARARASSHQPAPGASPRGPGGFGSRLQGGVQGDLHAGQRLADRPAGLRLLGGLLECVGVHALDAAADGELDPGDHDPAAILVGAEVDVGGHVQALRGAAGLGDAAGERHRVAGGVCRG